MIRARRLSKDSWGILVNKEFERPRCPETVVGDKIYLLLTWCVDDCKKIGCSGGSLCCGNDRPSGLAY